MKISDDGNNIIKSPGNHEEIANLMVNKQKPKCISSGNLQYSSVLGILA